MGNEERRKMFSEITKSLQVYTGDYGLAAPVECHVIPAYK